MQSYPLDLEINYILLAWMSHLPVFNFTNGKEDLNLQFFVAKKQNSKAPHPGHVTYLINHFRKCVEASFSSVVRLFPREIHAITSRGFELKVLTFILPFGFSRL
jgi:hypothetical protein